MDFAELFGSATGRTPFPYQRRLAEGESLPELMRIPTGSGKTAAAVLGWLHRRRFHPDRDLRRLTPRRLVYCLPMRVLVDQTLAAVRGWVERLGLAEQVGVFQLMGGAVERDWAMRPERDAIIVGTMDMLLSRAMDRGFAASRFRWPIEFGLLNNDCLWILDEVQLMGNGLATSAQLAAFRDVLGTARPCPSLWMSATVAPEWLVTVDHPAPSRVLELRDEDLATDLGGRVRAPKRLDRLAVEKWPEGGAAVLELHRPGTLTLVVTNTVDRARRVFEALRGAAPGDVDIQLLHSRFRPPDRRTAVRRILSPIPDAGRVVVATQVIEAGVDLSAATLVTELAPWGSIVQRLGRCNRFAEYEEALVAWVDLGDKEVEPYTAEELATVRERLARLEGGSVHPLALERLGPGDPPSARHVLRRVDLIDLFDTEPDLAGDDVDVSRFIRDDADADVHVFWRRLEGGEGAEDLTRPSSEELCPVPVWEVRGFLDRRQGRRRPRPGFVWDHLARRWRPLRPEELRPGLELLLDSEAGGYEPAIGWDPRAAGPVEPIEPAAVSGAGGEQEEGLADDPPEETSGAWVSLPDHLGHVQARLRVLLDSVDAVLEDQMREALDVAAFWHDVGKAHEVFQGALLEPLAEEERALRAARLWAKAPLGHRLSYERPYFRHELASALALLAAPPELHGLDGRALDLAAYLVAAHHGKVRVAIRSLPGEKRPPEAERRFARGVWDGDRLGAIPLGGKALPEVALDLSIMEVGRGVDGRPSWTERVLRLRDDLGPFRLAFLEALLRVADWEASAEESSGEVDA